MLAWSVWENQRRRSITRRVRPSERDGGHQSYGVGELLTKSSGDTTCKITYLKD